MSLMLLLFERMLVLMLWMLRHDVRGAGAGESVQRGMMTLMCGEVLLLLLLLFFR